MPTLEDTVDFKVATLNDLLDADVRTGVPVAADDKYKRWAFLSSGLAGMLLVALIISVVTGGGDNGGGGGAKSAAKSSKTYPNTFPVETQIGSSPQAGVELDAPVIIFDQDGTKPIAGATVTEMKTSKSSYGKATVYSVVLAVPNDDRDAVTAAKVAGAGKLTLVPGTFQPTTTTTAPTAAVPIEPAPATPPPKS